MKKKLLALFTMVLFILFSLAGCGGGEKKDSGGQPAGGKPAATQPAKEENLGGLLSKGKNVEGLYYEYKVTAKDMTMTGKMWLAGNKMKTEAQAEGQKVVTIFDGETYYTYMPDQNMAIKITADKSNKVSTPVDYTKDADTRPDKYKLLETVVYEGVKCKVVMVTGPDGKEQMKMWVHEEYGIPLRVELTETDGSKSVLEYKNLKVGPQTPETFKLPAGVQVTDMGEMMKNMPQMPKAPGSNQ